MAAGGKIRTSNGEGLVAPKKAYSRAASAGGFQRLVVTAGHDGIDLREGSEPRLAEGFAGQMRQALTNLRTVLATEGMGVEDIMMLTHYIMPGQDLAVLNAERQAFLGEARPASIIITVAGMTHPDMLYEVTAVAAR